MNFSKAFKEGLFSLSPSLFNEKALELFRYQAQNNKIYSKYIRALNIDPFKVSFLNEIPFLPIEFFKNHKVITGEDVPDFIFKSSGTTETGRSTHYVKDPAFYLQVSKVIFEGTYGSLKDHLVLGLLPSYRENPYSSLIYMIDEFFKEGVEGSGYVKSDRELINTIEKALKQNKKTVLFGVTFALLDLAEAFKADLNGLIIIETGGMKGRREEITRQELHRILKDAFNLQKIHSEYGMCELLSQAYATREGIFITPPWMKILLREMNDPFNKNENLKSGGINIIDLANVDSCAFIETKDIGRLFDSGFEVLGRFDNSDIRGCSQLIIS